MNARSLFRPLLALVLLCLTAGVSRADKLDVSLSASTTAATSSWTDPFDFTIQYAVSSTTGNATGSKVVLQLGAYFVIDSLTGTSHVTSQSYNAGTRQVTFVLQSPLSAGSSGQLVVRGHFDTTTPDKTKLQARATFSSANMGSGQSESVEVQSYVYVGQQFTFKDGVSLYKNGWWDVAPQSPFFEYWISHGNTGGPGRDINLYVIEDTLPAGTMLSYLATGYFSGTSNNVNLYYKTNKNGIYRAWTGNPRFNSGAEAWIYPGELNLPAGEWVTGVMMSYGKVPGGGAFHPDQWYRKSITIGAKLVNPGSVTQGQELKNCANVGGLNGIVPVAATSCASAWIDKNRIELEFYIQRPNNVKPGEVFSIGTKIKSNGNNATAMVNPVATLVLSKELEYVGNMQLSGDVWTADGKPAPTFEVVPDFDGTGRTLLRWKWKNWTIPPLGNWLTVVYPQVDVRVKAGTPLGLIRQYAYGGWQLPDGGCARVADTGDWDGDGVTSDTTCQAQEDINVYVDAGSGAAVAEAVNWVKGDLDTTWSKYPAFATTRPGGVADYQIKIRNAGGVTLSDFVLVDILPAVGDAGVVDTSARGSQWSPYLAGRVAVPDGAVVYYSTSGNPCRDELTPGVPAGCQTPNWTSTPPADITTVKSIKLDFGRLYLMANEEWTVGWPMRAPLSAPTGGEVAWNSFGYRASRLDNRTMLLASEPMKTGMKIVPPVPPYLGDRVWIDANRNGRQDAGEQGLNGVRVALYRDNGDGVPDLTKDTLESFTVTYWDGANAGAYLFSGMAPGKYFVAMDLPAGYMLTPANQAADDVDSDGTPALRGTQEVAVSEVTQIDLGEVDRTWDFGLVAADAVPAVWAVATQPDGSYVIGGRFSTASGATRKNIARLLPTGANDGTFNPGTGFDGEVLSVDLLSDKRVLVGGQFGAFNGSASKGYAILKTDGSYWGAPAQPDTADVRCVAALGDGRMLLGGSFQAVGGNTTARNLVRLTADGKVDATFKPAPNGAVNGIGRHDDGRCLIVGSFSSVAGVTRQGVARLNADGSVDPTFDAALGAENGTISSVVVQADGGYIITGNFTRFRGRAVNGTVRLLSSGALDTARGTAELSVSNVRDGD